MNYPLLSEYIEAIKSAEDNFEELSYLRPVLGDDGLPVMTSGNFAVVFKMKDVESGKFYAVKCFTKEQEGRAEAYREIAKELENVSSPYILSIRYLDKELFVDTDQTIETEFPVLLMDWVEGKTLDKYLRENIDDKYALEMLAYRFSQLAQWLIPQPFAHGDLKPDNTLVKEDGTLVLVDYDGMYVSAMKGQKARELGSPDFRHPLRTEKDFDEHIDDFPLISILLSLKTISLNPLLLDKYGTSDRLLFSVSDYRSISESIVVSEIQLFLAKEDCRNIMSIFLLSLTLKILPASFLKCLCVYFEGLNNEQYDSLSNELKEIISKAVVGDKVAQKSLGYKFYYGEELSQDYAKAIYWYRASASHEYPVAFYNLGICYQQGTGVNKSYFEAFKWFLLAAEKGYADAQYQVGLYYKGDMIGVRGNLSESFKWFDKAAQQGNTKAQKAIEEFDIYMRPIGKNGFHFFRKLAENGNKYGLYILGQCYWNGYGVNCDYNQAIEYFKKAALNGHRKAQWEVEKWKDSWWDGTSARYSANKEILKEAVSLYIDGYNIPEGTKVISDNAFFDLWNEIDFSYLDKVTIPSSVVSIGQCPFNKYLSQITCLSPYFEVENNTLYSKGKDRLIQCFAKTDVFVIPKEVRRIDNFAFCGCKSRHIILGQNVDSIGINPFVEMDLDGNKLIIESMSSKYEINNMCLCENGHKLIAYFGNDKVFRVHDDIDEIAEFAFCSSLLEIVHLPESLKQISDNAFWGCSRLKYASAPIDIALKHSHNGAINSYLLMLEDDGGTSEIDMEIIQAVYRQLPLDEVADSLSIDLYEIEKKLEELICCGWSLDIGYFLEDVMDNNSIDDIYNFIMTHKQYSLWLLIKKYLCEKYSEDEIRLVWIKYLYDKNDNMLSCWRNKEIMTCPDNSETTKKELEQFMNPLMKTTELERSVRQCMFQETPLDIFAESHSMDLHDVITLLEDFLEKGDTVDIDYFIENYLDKESVYEIYDYFFETGNDDLSTARHHLKKHSDDEIRLVRIKYLSDSASIKRGHKEFVLPF